MNFDFQNGSFFQHRIQPYLELTRLNKPVGSWLLLWPTLWALFLASNGWPDEALLAIFFFGTVLMRSAGCAINDYADRDFDKHVLRTANRPVTSGRISPKAALSAATVLALMAAFLLLGLNDLAKVLGLPAVFVAASYPYAKRFFAVPQAYLGIAFSFGIPMAYAAVLGAVPLEAWVLMAANMAWTIAYDTEYAMVDREDDLKIGIHTSAITFGRADVTMIMACYALSLLLLVGIGIERGSGPMFYLGLAVATGIAAYHWTLIRSRERSGCFKAFLHNIWFGGAVFTGIVLDLIRFS